MYILYLDESGTHTEARSFVLAGIAVFEREIHWFAQDVDALQQRYFPGSTEPVELHASKLRAPEDKLIAPYNTLTLTQRRQLAADMYTIIRERRGVLFGAVIEKAVCQTDDPYELAFEDLTSRFDHFLRRYNFSISNTGGSAQAREEQRGLIAVAESTYRENLEVLGERFRGGSTRWGNLHAIADVPFFLPAKNTRLLQIADFCSNAIFSRYNHGMTRDFDLIASKFDKDENGRVHGLSHRCADPECQCIACLTKQLTSRR
ncbi:MAG TPA: DUF3800 domain-containing protein [Pyrinomonadaceae bacterium]|jgi:hypothetical protein|nr:DUF3800 domain-containing protein [Pyrinomonadaceae bacterium]